MGTQAEASDQGIQDLRRKVKSTGSVTGKDDLRRKGKLDQAKTPLKVSEEKRKEAAAQVKSAPIGNEGPPDRVGLLLSTELHDQSVPTPPVTIGWTMKSRTIVRSLSSPRLLA